MAIGGDQDLLADEAAALQGVAADGFEDRSPGANVLQRGAGAQQAFGGGPFGQLPGLDARAGILEQGHCVSMVIESALLPAWQPSKAIREVATSASRRSASSQ